MAEKNSYREEVADRKNSGYHSVKEDKRKRVL
jgi:hypothetical protein